MLRQWIVRIDMFLTGINHEFFWDDLFSVQGTLMQKQMSKTSQFINRQIQSVSCHTMSLRAEGPVRIRNANRFKETISQIIQQIRSGFLFQKNRQNIGTKIAVHKMSTGCIWKRIILKEISHPVLFSVSFRSIAEKERIFLTG